MPALTATLVRSVSAATTSIQEIILSMRVPRRLSRSLLNPLSLLLVYTLTISLFSPFAIRRVEAAPIIKPQLQPAAAKEEKKGGRRDGELLVRFRQGVSEQDKTRLVEGKGMKRAKRLRGRSRLEKVTLKVGQELDALLADLRQNYLVELAEPNYLVSRDEVVPNDPSFNDQWALRNTGATGGQPGADIQAAPAWETTTGAQTTIIAVIDSGIDFTHPDLQNNQWTNTAESIDNSDNDSNGLVDDLHGWDWVRNSGTVVDENGHGTIIAGIIASEGNNSAGTTGVMWRAGLMSLRVLDNTGTGSVADAVEAIDYAAEHGARVINCSWGTDQESLALKEAIQRAGTKGVVVVSSAGNSGRDIEGAPYYPSSFGLSNQIAVASTDNFDRLASWSNYGATHVAVAAPGVDILTTKMGGGYIAVTGTSASAALVTGIAGLIKTKRWWLTASGTRAAIVDGARPVAELTGRAASGGVVSASGTLAALEGSETEPSSTPTPSPGGDGGGGTSEPGEGSVGPNMPDLNAERDRDPSEPVPPSQISADLPCLDCEPCGGSCGGEIPAGDSDFSTARLEPQNATGTPGVTLGSRNFNWSLPLVSLPGRSGMDLGVTLSYNSLVWTKDGSSVKFDAERGQPTAGFRIGLPTIQQRYYNAQTGLYNYLLVTPSGGRVELRQVGTTNTYESADGSYMKMTPDGAGGATVLTADGTHLTFAASVNNEMRCTRVRDRNGNYIAAFYNSTGRIARIDDTLKRTISFGYDPQNPSYLIEIKQLWGASWHYWAKFTYGTLTVQHNFTGLSVIGPQYNDQIGVLTQVWLHDGTRYKFDYTSWGQVYKIRKHGADEYLLSQTGYNLPGSEWLATSAQTDCPRFTQRRDWARDWNGDTDGVPATAEEAVTTYTADAGGAWSQQKAPDNTVYKEYYATTGWQKGMVTKTEVLVGTAIKKSTAMTWEQDDQSASYPTNPRLTDVTIEDEAGNKRRSKIEYYTGTPFSLPKNVNEYAADGTTLLRQTHTDYISSANYDTATRRIIGLPGVKTVYDGAGNVVSKVEFQYDEGGAWFKDAGAALAHHDTAFDGLSTYPGRGNVTSVRRWDADFPTDATKVVESNIGYNNAGSVVVTRDARGHQTEIDYADNFSVAAKNSLNTMAYPKTVTDQDGFLATAEYNYDRGAVTKTTSPTGGTGTAITYADVTYAYDSVGRTSRVTNVTNGAYTRWVYSTTNLLVEQYQTVSGTAEAYSATVLDGAGRVRGAAADHPGSTGLYSGQYFVYNNMGRPWKQSNPTEMVTGPTAAVPSAPAGEWTPAGDDSLWRYTTQTYDWKGRPLVTTFPDATKRTNAYAGCGCAGGEQVTATDERGRQKVYGKDVLGRLVKVEELNYDGTVYSTTNYAYDALDQLTEINQAALKRTFDYDGHGRLASRTTPEQGKTDYAYFADDTVQKVTDARGVTTTFAYNARHLPTTVTYNVTAAPGVAATPNVTYAYDAAGNRTSMVEKNSGGTMVGSSSYHYDELGRMDWEERFFQVVGTYRLSYSYNLGGQLTSVTGPSQFGNVQVGYTYDKVGRTTAVTGSGYSTVTSYVDGIAYRAFGAAREVAYGNTKTLSMIYDTRLRLTKWDLPGTDLRWNYLYSTTGSPEKTGRVAFANNAADGTLDRSYSYDQVGRLDESHSGNEANAHAGYTAWPAPGTALTGSYSSKHTYDEFGNMTSETGWVDVSQPYSHNFQYENNRMKVNPVTGAAMTYDAAGNLTNDGEQTYTYNAQGQQATAGGTSLAQTYDGDGLRVKKTENGVTTLYLRSSVLGKQVVLEIGGNSPNTGLMMRGYVYLGGQMVAVQKGGQVSWVHQDPVTKSRRMTDSSGNLDQDFVVDLDPWGVETGRIANPQKQPHTFTTYERDGNGGDEAMFRRYESKWARFSQPDPYEGSYDLSDPQSLNRYSYTQNDPVNFTDPNGLMRMVPVWGRFCVDTGGAPECEDTITGYIDLDAGIGGNIGGDPRDVGGGGRGGGGGGGGVDGGGQDNTLVPEEIAKINARVDAKYDGCAKLLGGSPLPTKEATKAILGASYLENGNSTLLAVTWAAESGFNFGPLSNPNDGAPNNADIGPVQINYRTYHDWAPLSGLGNVFGTTTTGREPFNGNPYDNVRAGSRILNSLGSGRTAAGHYRTGTGSFSRTPVGRAAFAARAKQYDRWAAGYDAFFNCLRG